ncbi:MAG: hypothetical protein ACU0DK_13065 [Pseudooceanicola sp.]
MPSPTSIFRLVRLHPIAATLFALASVLLLFFVLRTALFTLHWSEESRLRAAPEPWMTPRYVAHSWQIDPQEIAEAISMPEGMERRPTLEQIARARGVPVEVVLDELASFLAERRTE